MLHAAKDSAEASTSGMAFIHEAKTPVRGPDESQARQGAKDHVRTVTDVAA
jgi:hypothetical protein